MLLVNVTAGPLRSYIIDNPVNATCDGNVYSVVRTCCTQLRGITNSSSISCDAYCCTYSSGGLNGTCPVGKFKYPYCVLPTHLNYTDWDACYAPLVREIQDTMKEPPIATCGCTPPSSAVRCAVPVVLGFLVSVAVSVLSM